MLFAHLKLLIRRSGGNHTRSYYLANLNCRETNASCRTKHEQRLSWLKLGSIFECMMRCSICHHKGGCSGEIYTARHRDQPRCISNNLFSKTTQASECNHPVAHLGVIYTLRDLFDNSSNLAARYKRKWWFRLVFALDNQSIGEVHTTRLHANNHLAFPRL